VPGGVYRPGFVDRFDEAEHLHLAAADQCADQRRRLGSRGGSGLGAPSWPKLRSAIDAFMIWESIDGGTDRAEGDWER